MTGLDPALLKALQRRHTDLVDDLRQQAGAVPKTQKLLQEQYDGAKRAGRTGAAFSHWREEQLDQAAVAWLLGTVFVRFCEDNDLISGAWIAGPGPATEAAAQAQTAYFIQEPKHTDRDWIRQGFTHLQKLKATAALFDEDHNPVWRMDISADAAGALLDFWRRGPGVHSFVDDKLDTRFLGDLYQDLSGYARKRYALLQTPEFVEEFILDLALTPSIAEYGLAETSVIDPTCGSGHFLIGAFHRLHALWVQREPATDPRVRVQRALHQVTGIDINAAAVNIARFRLLIAAMQACGDRSMESAVGFDLRLATGDSLLGWNAEDTSHQGDLTAEQEGRDTWAYFTEDANRLADYIQRGRYTVAVGNPPYITVADRDLSEKHYRPRYRTCSGKYALSVPFIERFFQLVRPQDQSGRAGFVGQITANSFMKREFGKKLIEHFFAGLVDPKDTSRRYAELSHVIDTSGAYIPGHGTPTVILIGRRRYPKLPKVRAVLGVLGEPSTPADPAKGLVWTAIAENLDRPGAANPYVTVADIPRSSLTRHPWSLSGGEAGDLKAAIESAAVTHLNMVVEHSGFVAITAEDDAFLVPSHGWATSRSQLPLRPMVEGDAVRDYTVAPSIVSVWPYDDDLKAIALTKESPLARFMWPNRRVLKRRRRFGRFVETIDFLEWYEYGELYREKLRTPLSIVFAFVATHNHFVLDRGGKVFNRTAPVIKLGADTTEDDHLELLGLLNSSTACFWIKQVSQSRGSTIDSKGARQSTVPWEDFYEHTATRLQEFPLPEGRPLGRARRLDGLAQELAAVRPAAVCAGGIPTREALRQAHLEYDRLRGEMIAEQEELDWEVYRLYGLLDDDLTAPEDSRPALTLGERAFEIVLARTVAAGETETQWFTRHGSTPITEIPAHWPAAYQTIVERRIKVIEERSDIALIERPECKRRWAATPWETQEKEALRGWLLDRLEAESLWRERGAARVLSVAQLADRIGVDPDFRSVLALWCGRDDYDLAAEVVKLTADEAVPFLAAYRYKPSGLRKRAEWEHTWELQRQEDRGEAVGDIPVPPKYASVDFARPSYWRHRGKLDVPKERFILYPKAGKDADKTPVLGWAGWSHLDQAQALATLYMQRRNDEDWPAQRLLPLLAGLVELEPWLHQWYTDAVPGYPGSPADFYTSLINSELNQLGRARAHLTADTLTEATR